MGCIILPDDSQRPWTRSAMMCTQRFLLESGWGIREKIDCVHKYHLDDDRNLASSTILVEAVPTYERVSTMPFTDRQVGFAEIPHFYGRTIAPPYPRYIRLDGSLDYRWTNV